jgi:hypothetical protein
LFSGTSFGALDAAYQAIETKCKDEIEKADTNKKVWFTCLSVKFCIALAAVERGVA